MTTKQVTMRDIKTGDTISRGGKTLIVTHVERHWNGTKSDTTFMLSELLTQDSDTLILKVEEDGDRTES